MESRRTGRLESSCSQKTVGGEMTGRHREGCLDRTDWGGKNSRAL